MADKNYYEYTGQRYSFFDEVEATPVMMGIVENSADPLMLGRVQVRVPSLHKIPNDTESYISDLDLPWARPGVMNCAGNDYGQYLPPIPGTRVWVIFEDGDPDKPIYLGGVPTLIDNAKTYNKNNPSVLGGEFDVITNDTPSEILSANPNRYVVYKSIKGATIAICDEDYNEYLEIIDQSGQVITMGNYGNSSLNRRIGGQYVNNDSYIKINHDQYKNIILDDNHIKITYQKSMDPDFLEDYDHTQSVLDMDLDNRNDIYSIDVSDDGINIESKDINKIKLNGKSLTDYIKSVVNEVINSSE